MIDYVKVVIKDTDLSKHLLSNLDLLFDTHSSTATTTAGKKIVNVYAFYNGLRFKITQSGVVIVDGSLHKAMNKGTHNHNDFSYVSLLRVIADLCTRFSIDPNRAVLQNLEIGVNINTSFDPLEFTDRCAFLFTGAGVTKPSPITKNDGDGFNKGIRFELSEYCMKIYNKSAQYNRDENILRVEYKTKRIRPIDRVGIKTLYDLCDINKLQMLADNYLLDRFNCILIDEVVDVTNLNNRERQHFNKRLDYVSYYRDISASQRKRNRGYINNIYNKYALSDFKDIVRDLIISKSKDLLCFTGQCPALLATIENTNCTSVPLYYKHGSDIQLRLAA